MRMPYQVGHLKGIYNYISIEMCGLTYGRHSIVQWKLAQHY